MDLGIPDVDAQNPLWSLSGDLSSLGCLWCTLVSAEVLCELLHTKSRFLREEVRAHTHTPTPTQTPAAPLSCTLLAGPAPKRSDLRRNLSHGFRWLGWKRQGRFCSREGRSTAELRMARSVSSRSRLTGKPRGCCCPPCFAETQPVGRTCRRRQPSPLASPELPVLPGCSNFQVTHLHVPLARV